MAAQQLSTNFRKLELSKIETAGPLRLDPVARPARPRNCETARRYHVYPDATLIFARDRRGARNFTYPSGNVQLPACKRDSGVFRIVEGYQCRRLGDREEVKRGHIGPHLVYIRFHVKMISRDRIIALKLIYRISSFRIKFARYSYGL